MTRKSDDSNDYEVGYGKPPKHGQFVKGRSGNPKGRTKGKTAGSMLRAVLDQPVVVTKDGRSRTVKFSEALMHKVVGKALNGTTRDHIMLLRFIQEHAPDLLREAPSAHRITVEFV